MIDTPDLLLKNIKPVSETEDGTESVDIRIADGVIEERGTSLQAADGEEIFDASGAYVSAGWFDMHVHLREPGFEHKETIETGCDAAAAGGFTEVACMPNTNPPIHTRDVVEYVKNRAEDLPVEVHPIGTVSKQRKGKSLAEMADMKEGGAVAFSDDGDPVYDAQLMRIAMNYASMLGLPIINHEEDYALSRPGHMHEGRVSARLGLEGSPSVAEEVMIARDLLLAEMTGAHIHVAHISTRRGVELVREAKKRGVNVTTEVCAHHFDLTDEEIERRNFDTHCKMHPPLRTADDVEAMIEGLADGTIDAICTDHAPHAVEEKEVEFIYAPNGIIGLETCWGVAVERLLEPGHLNLQELVKKITIAPRKILKVPVPQIKEGAPANLTIFETNSEWTYGESQIRSKSNNSPYLDRSFKGKPVAIYNKNQFVKTDR